MGRRRRRGSRRGRASAPLSRPHHVHSRPGVFLGVPTVAALPGGGAEIFQQEVRARIARGKETAEEYLDVHRTWHRLGGHSTCTMLFGHLETMADRVDHMRQLRELQDETGGFTGFIPLPSDALGPEVGGKRWGSGWMKPLALRSAMDQQSSRCMWR